MSKHPNSLKNLNPIKKGEVRNPAGRPKGSRNLLSEAFITKMHDDFKEHGAQAIVDMREKSPVDYMRVIASIIPKQLNVTNEDSKLEELLESMSDGELGEFVEGIRLLVAAQGGGEGEAQEGITGRPDKLH